VRERRAHLALVGVRLVARDALGDGDGATVVLLRIVLLLEAVVAAPCVEHVGILHACEALRGLSRGGDPVGVAAVCARVRLRTWLQGRHAGLLVSVSSRVTSHLRLVLWCCGHGETPTTLNP
jgi:hypothetical protein